MKHDFLYEVEREYPVSIEVLWNAWVDAAQLEQWYHPTVLSVPAGTTTSEAEVGGKWTVAVAVPAEMTPNGQAYNAMFFGRYTEVEPRRLLVHTMHYTVDPEEFAAFDESTPNHLVRVDFEARGENSWCKFTQFGEMPEAQIEMTKAGMTSYFDSLEQFLAA